MEILFYLVTTNGAELLQPILGIGLVTGANDTVLHATACKDVTRVRHDGRDVLGAGQAGHGIVVLDGGAHAGHVVPRGLHQVHRLGHGV